MFCKKCGNALPTEGFICKICGTMMDKDQIKEQKENLDKKRQDILRNNRVDDRGALKAAVLLIIAFLVVLSLIIFFVKR